MQLDYLIFDASDEEREMALVYLQSFMKGRRE